MEAVQQQSVPISEARLISPAMRPPRKSAPRLSIVLLVTLASGAFLSFGIAYLREAGDGTLRTTGSQRHTAFQLLGHGPDFDSPHHANWIQNI